MISFKDSGRALSSCDLVCGEVHEVVLPSPARMFSVGA